MKNLFILILFITITLSCKAQSNLTLGDGPFDLLELPTPIHINDLNNIRDAFFGVWQGSVGNSELTLYIYKIDNVPVKSLISDIYSDEIFGYYIYKENGVEIINSRNEALLHNTPQTLTLAPFQGGSINNQNLLNMHFIDYGISIEQPDGSLSNGKGCLVNLTTIDNGGINNLQANFELRNIGEVLRAYNYDFSIPTNMVLTKIANTPPPLD